MLIPVASSSSIILLSLLQVQVATSFIPRWKFQSNNVIRAQSRSAGPHYSVRQEGGEWIEWVSTDDNDLIRLSIDCYNEGRMIIDPWLLSEFLLETGAYSSIIEDAAKGSKYEMPRSDGLTVVSVFTSKQTPIFGEYGEPAASEKIWTRSAVAADYPVDQDLSQLLTLVKEVFQLEDQPKYKVERIADRDWVKEVQEGWKPIQLGKQLLIRFTWHGEEDLVPFKDIEGLQVMRLEGGAAFGSGEHPTTSMCAEWLEQYIDQESKAGRKPSVIDYGSGSGILAMTSLMFGAERAIGIEIDPVAILSAYRNAEMNDIEMLYLLPQEESTLEGTRVSYRVVQPDGEIEEDEVGLAPADIVAANILARPLVQLSTTIAGLTKPGGKIALAGLLEEQAETVMEAYRPYFEIRQENQEGDWALLVGTRR